MDTIKDVLIYQTQMMRNSSLGPYVPSDFSPPEYIVLVNALFYASLGITILAAFIAMLIKSWVREFDRGLRTISIPEQRAKTREFRYLGMERWKLQEMVAVLPLLIQLSLLLFAIGLVGFLFHISTPSFGVTTTLFGVGALFYATTTTISVFATSSPFHSPLSRTLGKVYRRVHAHFCPGLDVFLSPNMDATPVTALGRLYRRVQIFLQKSRPYLESDFVEPITATTVDDIQLSTTASALQRIHDSVPNSQHSELIHRSVWQVAGSPALRLPPSFDLPPWIIDRGNDKEYFSRLSPASVVAFTVVFLRMRDTCYKHRIAAVADISRAVSDPKEPWARLVYAIFNALPEDFCSIPKRMIRSRLLESVVNILTTKPLCEEQAIWLLNTLSGLHCDDRVDARDAVSEICLAILFHQAPRWSEETPPNILLIEAVVTFATISCPRRAVGPTHILDNSHQYPWLLLNLRNTELISETFNGTVHFDRDRGLTPLLFLVIYALILRRAKTLVAQYLAIITERDGFRSCPSALAIIAPALGGGGFTALGRLLLAPKILYSTPDDSASMLSSVPGSLSNLFSHQGLFESYDLELGVQFPDPNIFVPLLLLSKKVPSDHLHWARKLSLSNPWLQLAVKVIARVDVSDESGLNSLPFHDHRVHNMIAALCLRRYSGRIPYERYVEPYLFASFLESSELAVSSLALLYHIRAVLSSSNPRLRPSGSSCHLFGAVHAVFNPKLPEHYLLEGFAILDVFVGGFEQLSVAWRQTFAEAFFTMSRRPLLKRSMRQDTPQAELEEILTWGYFCEENREPDLTDTEFNGLDWMTMTWSLYFSPGPDAGETVRVGRNSFYCSYRRPRTAGFVLRALCKLLDVAPYHIVIPVIPKLREFVTQFENPELSYHRSVVAARVEQVLYINEEFQRSLKSQKFLTLSKFQGFDCTWHH